MTKHMADNAPPEQTDDEALRKRLLNRIALAGVAIVALLGGLAIVDSMYVSPTPAASKASLPEPVKPVEPIAISPTIVSATTAELPEPPEPPKPQAVPTLPPATTEESELPSSAAPEKTKTRRDNEAKEISSPAQGYLLQMGVFNNVDHAQELFAKLKQAGIPAQIESRVQVGPFKTKTEAEEMRAKLKGLGLDSALLLPLRK